MYSDQSKEYLKELVTLNKKDLVSIGYEKLTVAGTAVTFASLPDNATYAILRLESSITTMAIRHLEYGGTPTNSVGMPMFDGEIYTIVGRQNLTKFKAIQAAAGTHDLNIEYFK